MVQTIIKLTTLSLIFTVLVACGGDKEKEKSSGKKEGAKTAKVLQTDEKVIQLGSLGFTTDELVENWNESQAQMHESGSYQLKPITVTNGEFKTDISEGLILEGLVNEETKEVARLSLIKKMSEGDNLQASLDNYEDTIAAFFLLVAATNHDEKVNEKDIGALTTKLGLMQDNDNVINGSADLNNITYKVNENERGLVMTATEKKKK